MTKAFRRSLMGAQCALALCAFPLPAGAQTPGRTVAESPPPAWPAPVRPAADAPTVLLIMTDDVGFGATSTFGGPVTTAAFDALARRGTRFNQMHTTGICSPTRAALLTGRNHNVVNMGNVEDAATGYEGYTGVIPKSTATVAALLRQAGYSTAMFGKAHFTPQWETSPAGPFDRWPTGLGFDYFYGFLSGDTNQWAPALYENTRAIEANSAGDPDYILDRDLADRAIGWMREQTANAPGKPQFLYFAPGTSHAPHHAPKDWIEKFRGRFDRGWDAIREETLANQKKMGAVPPDTRLSARPAEVPAWSSLTPLQQKVFARQMEVYAGALAYADHQIGRVIEEARRQFGDRLMIVYLQGDNGASAEGGLNGVLNENAALNGVREDFDTLAASLEALGGPMALNHHSYGWAYAMNTPFPWVKQIASHLGATRNGMVIDWPGHVSHPEKVRHQFQHVIDIAPTILEAAQVTPPDMFEGVAQKPFDGISLRYTLDNADAAPRRRTQYFAMWDNMAIYHNGWMASTYPESLPWNVTTPRPTKIDGRVWELYDLNGDFSQSRNIAADHPDKLGEMQKLFWAKAALHNALPIHRGEGRDGRPSYLAGRTRFVYDQPISRIPEEVAPPLLNRSFTLRAEVEIGAESGASGVLFAQGGRFGGMSWYLKEGRPVFAYNLAGVERYQVEGASPLSAGRHLLEAAFTYDGGPPGSGGAMTLRVNGKNVGSGRFARTLPQRMSLDEGFDVGSDTGTPVTEDYASPAPFAGRLVRLEVDNDPTRK